MMMSDDGILIHHEDIFRTGVALLAFVVAFYAVIARERKTPYIVNSIYAVTFVVLAALLLSLAASILEPAQPAAAPALRGTNAVPAISAAGGSSALPSVPGIGSPTRTRASRYLNWAAAAVLGYGIVFIFYRVWRIQSRQVNFRDDQLLLTIPPVRWYRSFRQKIRQQKAYEHNPMKLSPELITSLNQSPFLPKGALDRALEHSANEQAFSTSVAVLVPTHMEADRLMADIATRFLDRECYVQYTTCCRHPIEFLLYLERRWRKEHKEGDWTTVGNRIVVVDGYTPHFGFTDTIYTEWSRAAKGQCLDCIHSEATYAGIHTAIANGFNKVKKERGKPRLRAPALYIYEGMHALVDVESSEQYRVFLRHVIPSERLWGGMFTLFVDSSVSDSNLAVLREITHLFVDRRNECAAAPFPE